MFSPIILNGDVIEQVLDGSCFDIKINGRDFEYIILQGVLSYCENRAFFLKRIYKLLENSAFLIIIEKDYFLKPELFDILEQNNYLASNDIDIFKDHLLIISKKMHMWSNNL